MLKAPELALEKDEADSLAAAISEVEKHYSVSLSPETRAWLGLGAVCAMVYGPRAYTILNRRKTEKRSGVPAQVSAPVKTAAPKQGGEPTTEGGPPPAIMGASDFGF